MSKTLWKSMLTGPRSANGDEGAWKIGEWRKCPDDLEMCSSGYHASRNVIDSMRYVDAGVIAQVEVRGKHLEQNDKQCWEEMRLLKTWTWTKEDSVSLAIYAAELVIDIFEAKYPGDNRPRQAIEAAKNWLANPNEENRAAAWMAAEAAEAAAEAARAAAGADGAAAWMAARAAAWAAEAARAAAWAAAWAAGAARAAAEAAWAAAEAAGAARAAAWMAAGAARAAWAAASNKITVKCHRFVLRRLKEKKRGKA